MNDPESELGKLLLQIVLYLGALEPQAFKNVNVETALKQVDQMITLLKYGSK